MLVSRSSLIDTAGELLEMTKKKEVSRDKLSGNEKEAASKSMHIWKLPKSFTLVFSQEKE